MRNLKAFIFISSILWTFSAAGEPNSELASGALSGVVVSGGTPVQNAQVNVYHLSAVGKRYTATFATQTDSLGKFLFPSLPTGSYVVLIWKNGDRVYQGQVAVLDQSTLVNISLPPVSHRGSDGSHGMELEVRLPVKRLSHATLSPEGLKLAGLDSFGNVQLGSLSASSRFKDLTKRGPIQVISFSPDGKKLSGITRDGWLQSWDAETGHILSSQRLHLSGRPQASGFSPVGGARAIISDREYVTIWSVFPTRAIASRLLTDQVSVALSANGSRLVVTNRNGTLDIYEVPSWRRLAQTSVLATSLGDIGCNQDGTRVIVAADRIVKLIDGISGKVMADFAHKARVSAVAISPDGRRLASSDLDNTVYLWDSVLKDPLFHLEHKTKVVDLEFTADGGRLMMANESGDVIVYLVR